MLKIMSGDIVIKLLNRVSSIEISSPTNIYLINILFCTGGTDVCFGGHGIRAMLATVPCVLRAGVPPPITSVGAVRSAYLFGLLLASHGKLHVQPSHLLLDE